MEQVFICIFVGIAIIAVILLMWHSAKSPGNYMLDEVGRPIILLSEDENFAGFSSCNTVDYVTTEKIVGDKKICKTYRIDKTTGLQKVYTFVEQ